jgi:N-acetylglucosamine kinase-like BadF-type ATPase
MPVEDCRDICIGTAGADRADEKSIIKEIIRVTGFFGRIIVTNDAEIALYGGTHGEEGIIIISGTGSICYGRNSSGDICRAGGWGHIIGDEGSGYDIGAKALRAIVRSYDGRAENTIMTSMILEHLKIEKPEGLINYVYRSGIGKQEIAGLAYLVDKAYNLGDAAAGEILKGASYELYLCCRSVVERLGFRGKPVLQL